MNPMKPSRLVLLLSIFGFSLTFNQLHAATISLTDGVYTNVKPFTPIPSNPVVFTEVVDDITFTFTALSNLTGGPRFQITDANGTASVDARAGIAVGGGGGSSISFSISASESVNLDSYFTGGILPSGAVSNNFLNADAIFFSIFDQNDNALSTGNSLAASAEHIAFNQGPISMEGGLDYKFLLTGAWGASSQSFIKEFNFTRLDADISEVPIPAAWLLFMSGLIGVSAIRKKKLHKRK
jgi:hypothetical protein